MIVVLVALAVGLVASAPVSAQTSATYEVRGDEIPNALAGRPGDPTNGAKLMADRHRSLCILCHAGPFSAPHTQGDIAPSLADVGGRLSAGQIRLRVANIKALNPESLMPAYLKVADRPDIAEAWRGKSILSPAEIEDIVAYLVTLKE